MLALRAGRFAPVVTGAFLVGTIGCSSGDASQPSNGFDGDGAVDPTCTGDDCAPEGTGASSESSGGASSGAGWSLGSRAGAGGTSGGTAGSGTGGTPSGGSGGGGGVGPTLPPEPAVELIDDLEDGDGSIIDAGGRVGEWYVFNDGAGSQTPTAGATFIPDGGGADGSGYAAHTTGSGFSVWGAGIAVDFNNPGSLPTDSRRAAYDLSGFDGFSFWAKGPAGRDTSVRFEVVTRAVADQSEGGTCTPRGDQQCFDSHGMEIQLTDSWAKHEIPMSSLVQEGWGVSASYDPSQVFGAAFQHLNTNTSFDFWIDDLAVYRDPPGGGSGGGNVTPGRCLGDLGGYSEGSITWYYFDQGPTITPNCGFDITARNPDAVASIYTGGGQYFGAMNTYDYDTAAVCGACVELTRDGSQTVTITIVDQCPVATNPKCTPGHIDLSQEAFKQLGALDEGYVGTGNGAAVGQISWRYVPCPVDGNVTFRLKEASNPHWNGVVVQGHRYPIASVRIRVGNQWVNASRQDYNFWLPPGGSMGSAPYEVEATDVNGSTMTATLQLTSGDQGGSQQFPVCQ